MLTRWWSQHFQKTSCLVTEEWEKGCNNSLADGNHPGEHVHNYSACRKDESEGSLLMGIVLFILHYLQSIHCVHRIAVITQWPTLHFFFTSFLPPYFPSIFYFHTTPPAPCIDNTLGCLASAPWCAFHQCTFLLSSFASSRWQCAVPFDFEKNKLWFGAPRECCLWYFWLWFCDSSGACWFF